jgi:hypothetical protein
MKNFSKLNSILIIIMILFSYIYSSKNKSKSKNLNKFTSQNKNDSEDLLNSDSKSEKEDDLYKFFNKETERERETNTDIEKETKKNNNFNVKNNIKRSNKYIKKNKRQNQIKNLYKNEMNMLETSFKKKNKRALKAKKNYPQAKLNKNYPKAKLFSQYNPYYPVKKSIIAENTRESYCKYKTGFLHLVKHPKNLGPFPLSLRTIPIYVSLTMDNFKLQMGPESKTLFNIVKIENVLRITKIFSNANCFEIVEDNVLENTLAKIPITLCAGNYNIMFSWVKAIQQFKNCIYNTKSSLNNDQDETVLDFHNINTILKTKNPRPKYSNSKSNALDQLIYSSQNSGSSIKNKSRYRNIIEETVNIAKDSSEHVMEKELGNIVNLLEKGDVNKKMIERKMDTKLKSAGKIEYDIRKKKHMIENILEKREKAEKDKENQIRNEVHKKREIQLLKAVKSRIRQYKVRIFKEFKKIYFHL